MANFCFVFFFLCSINQPLRSIMWRCILLLPSCYFWKKSCEKESWKTGFWIEKRWKMRFSLIFVVSAIIKRQFAEVQAAVYLEDHRQPGGNPIDLDALLPFQAAVTALLETADVISADLDTVHANSSTPESSSASSVTANETTVEETTSSSTVVQQGKELGGLVVPDVAETLCAVEVNSSSRVTADKWSPTDTSSPAVQAAIAALHNAYRRKHPAANMLEMEWNEEAARLAQSWADACTWNHSECSQRRTSSELMGFINIHSMK